MLGLEVPHAHIDLVPMQSEKDMNFSAPKLKLSDEEFAAIAAKILAEYEKIAGCHVRRNKENALCRTSCDAA